MNDVMDIRCLVEDQFVWFPERGMGFRHPGFRADEEVYDDSYWETYQALRETKMGVALTKARVALLMRYAKPGDQVKDVGIGAGAFLEAAEGAGYAVSGTDVNPRAIKWLIGRGAGGPAFAQADVVTFWDSLEHLERPEAAVACARRLVLVSLPIFKDAADVLASKHYKPGEHIWYWTRDGLVDWFQRQGWSLLEENQMETDLGREAIGSFAFLRDSDLQF